MDSGAQHKPACAKCWAKEKIMSTLTTWSTVLERFKAGISKADSSKQGHYSALILQIGHVVEIMTPYLKSINHQISDTSQKIMP